MHEYGITKQIVDIASDAAQRESAKKVNSISLVIGEEAGLLPDSIHMYFSHIAAGTAAEGAKLCIRWVPAEIHCPRCDKNFPRPRFSFTCPDCGALGCPTAAGYNCYVESLSLEI